MGAASAAAFQLLPRGRHHDLHPLHQGLETERIVGVARGKELPIKTIRETALWEYGVL